MGKMRGGRKPTAVEVQMMAEARDRLADVCKEYAPKDVFPRDAFGTVIEDLGLNRLRNQKLGIRSPKLSLSRITKTQTPFLFSAQLNIPPFLRRHCCCCSSFISIWAKKTQIRFSFSEVGSYTMSSTNPNVPLSEEELERKKKKEEKAKEKELKKQKAAQKAAEAAKLKAQQVPTSSKASKKKPGRADAGDENPEDFIDPETSSGDKKKLSKQMAKQFSPEAVEKSYVDGIFKVHCLFLKLFLCRWYAWWEKSGFFEADSNSSKPPFTIVLPPPNVAGALHIGHALTAAI